MGTRVPRAWETSWAQEAIADEVNRPADQFTYPGHKAEPSGEVVYLVDRLGMCQAADAALVQTEHWRVVEAKGPTKVSPECSVHVQAGPAQGQIRSFSEGYWHRGDDGREWRNEIYRSGRPGVVRDVFDEMTDQATRRGGKPPFTAAQVAAGRGYRTLHERVQSAGMQMSSAFDDKIRGQGKVDFMDSYMADKQLLDFCENLEREHTALSIRKLAAHSMDRGTRRNIPSLTLLHMVCISQEPLNAVLAAHGWSLAGKNRKALRAALCASLGRLGDVWGFHHQNVVDR